MHLRDKTLGIIWFALDSTQSTSADRFRVYINGVLETSFSPQLIQSQDFANVILMFKHRFIWWSKWF